MNRLEVMPRRRPPTSQATPGRPGNLKDVFKEAIMHRGSLFVDVLQIQQPTPT